jgi:hypothetical protein
MVHITAASAGVRGDNHGMRERSVIRSIGEGIDPGRTLVALAASVAAAFALACVAVLLWFSWLPAGGLYLVWSAALACYLGAIALTAPIARRFGSNRWLAMGTVVLTWPPMFFGVWTVVFFATFEMQ